MHPHGILPSTSHPYEIEPNNKIGTRENSSSIHPSTLSNTADILPEQHFGNIAEYISEINTIGRIALICLAVIPSIIYVIGFIANIMLISYIIRYRRYRSTVFAIILCLSIADLSMCYASFTFVVVIEPFFVGPWWACPLGMFILHTSVVSGSVHLTCVAILRFYQLVYPLSARAKLTPGFVGKISHLIWLFALVNGPSLSVCHGEVIYTGGREPIKLCIYVKPLKIIRDLWIMLVFLIIPFIIATIFHLAKYSIVNKESDAVTSATSGDQTRNQKKESTDARALVVVVMVFLMTTLPVSVEFVLNALFNLPSVHHPLLGLLADKVLFSNSAINPFIYAFAAQSLRNDILRMFRCVRKSAKNQSDKINS